MRRIREPKATCPELNEVQDKLKDLGGEIKQELWSLAQKLEALRSQNEELRAWGQQECDRADEAEKEVESLGQQVDRLQRDIESLIDPKEVR